MKKLYIRFFLSVHNHIPHDSHLVFDRDTDSRTMEQRIGDYAENVDDWMVRHPDGKVDFVWL